MMRHLQGTVTLPGSKSESNRALMIAAYGGFPLDVDNLSEAHDTVLLKSLLESVSLHAGCGEIILDCEDAGTVIRFLMTYLANKPGTWILTGTERLLQRPMAPLIEALRQLGADISFVPSLQPQQGARLRIVGHPLKGGTVTLDASQSSQFASSLLMAAPTWEQGLHLTLTGNLVSMPYLEMTLSMMKLFGVHVARKGNDIIVAHQSYQPSHFTVSADWSAASYWYEMLALSDGGRMRLNGLRDDSLQGDRAVADFFSSLGVNTIFDDMGVLISSEGGCSPIPKPLEFDVSNAPDLFPSILVSCVALHIEAVFYNISILYQKESDRINSLISELSKYYTFINIIDRDKLVIKRSFLSDNNINKTRLTFNTYGDHRLAMALAGLTMKFQEIVFDRPDVVNKSYPAFWDDFKKHVGN